MLVWHLFNGKAVANECGTIYTIYRANDVITKNSTTKLPFDGPRYEFDVNNGMIGPYRDYASLSAAMEAAERHSKAYDT